jgi:hypothetical protein
MCHNQPMGFALMSTYYPASSLTYRPEDREAGRIAMQRLAARVPSDPPSLLAAGLEQYFEFTVHRHVSAAVAMARHQGSPVMPEMCSKCIPWQELHLGYRAWCCQQT